MVRTSVESSPGWTRTSDNSINSRTLYQLSYRGSVSCLVVGLTGRRVESAASSKDSHTSRPINFAADPTGRGVSKWAVQDLNL